MIYTFVPQIGKLSLANYRHMRIHKKFSLKQKSIAEKGKIGSSVMQGGKASLRKHESPPVVSWLSLQSRL